MNAVALGLGAALCWGAADVIARFAARAVGAYRALLYVQLVGTAALTAYLAARGELAALATTVPPAGWTWGILAGVLNTGAALALYHALATGVLALVSAIAGSYATVTVALSVVSGERLTTLHALGIAFAIGGVVLASFAPTGPAVRAAATANHARALGWAGAASLGFGVTFWLIGFRVTPVVGGLASVWLLRATALALLLVARPLVARPPPARGATRALGTAGMLVAVGALDTLGFVANNVGTTLGLVSVVSVLGSLFGGVTVLIAWLVLGERLAARQWLGVALILAGVALVSA